MYVCMYIYIYDGLPPLPPTADPWIERNITNPGSVGLEGAGAKVVQWRQVANKARGRLGDICSQAIEDHATARLLGRASPAGVGGYVYW